jgi:hypothetical protein
LNACLPGTLLFLFRSQSHVLHDQNVQTPAGAPTGFIPYPFRKYPV